MPEVVCPQCKNPIYDDDALLCHFCGSSLRRTSAGLLGAMRGAGLKWVVVTLAILIVISFILISMS